MSLRKSRTSRCSSFVLTHSCTTVNPFVTPASASPAQAAKIRRSWRSEPRKFVSAAGGSCFPRTLSTMSASGHGDASPRPTATAVSTNETTQSFLYGLRYGNSRGTYRHIDQAPFSRTSDLPELRPLDAGDDAAAGLDAAVDDVARRTDRGCAVAARGEREQHGERGEQGRDGPRASACGGPRERTDEGGGAHSEARPPRPDAHARQLAAATVLLDRDAE